MGLLRACADGVLLGAGTLRATPGHRWTAGHIFPALASSFSALRSKLGLSPEPRLLLITGRGDVDLEHPALEDGATVITTSAGARRLAGMLPPSCDVIELGESGAVDLRVAVDELRRRGHQTLLTEGGPHVMGELIKAGVLDEAFVTVSPVLAGRDREPRYGMIEGVELLPGDAPWTRLLSARRHGDFLFLRYGLRR